MRDQGTSYGYSYLAIPLATVLNGGWNGVKFMGDQTYTILQEPSRWPMLRDQPGGFGFTGNLSDPPASAVPHSGGLNVAYGDGHAKYHHLKTADGGNWGAKHLGDGIFPGQ